MNQVYCMLKQYGKYIQYGDEDFFYCGYKICMGVCVLFFCLVLLIYIGL